MYEVVKGIWLGGYNDCFKKMPTIHLGEDCHYRVNNDQNLFFEIRDFPENAPEILPILDQSEAFITKWRKVGRGVFVHCTMGISRSATLVFLYLIRMNEIKTQADFRSLYTDWSPNDGFQQLFRDQHIV